MEWLFSSQNPGYVPGLLAKNYIMIYFIGVVVSLLVQWLKNLYGTSGYKTMLVLAGVSLLAAIVYTYFTYLGVWEIVAQVLMVAGAFYAFVLSQFEK